MGLLGAPWSHASAEADEVGKNEHWKQVQTRDVSVSMASGGLVGKLFGRSCLMPAPRQLVAVSERPGAHP
eukprot:418247-Pyramimonas_sp.AAC.1